MLFSKIIITWLTLFASKITAWKVSRYGPEKTPYLETFHAENSISKELTSDGFYYMLYFFT